MSLLDDADPALRREIDAALAALDDEERTEALRLYEVWARGEQWRIEARDDQIAPAGAWVVWLILAGRGWGKTRTGGEWIVDKGRRFPRSRCALIAPTYSDGRDTMVEGESGILSLLSPEELRGGSVERAWNRSLGELVLANGTRYKIFSSERRRQLRGPQHHFAWGDEPAQWADAHLGTQRDTTYSNLLIGCRLPAREEWSDDLKAEYRPQVVLTTTPRPIDLLRGRQEEAADGTLTIENPGLLDEHDRHPDTYRLTRGRTRDNLANLSETYRQTVIEPLVGTRLGQQELDALILEDVEGAIFSLDLISRRTWRWADLVYVRTVVSVDPSGSERGDATGITAESLTDGGLIVVRADRTRKGEVSKRYAAAVDLAAELGAGEIVYEGAYGGDNVAGNIKTAIEARRLRGGYEGPDAPPIPRVVSVPAKGSKADRASGVAQIFEVGRAYLLPGLPLLVDEATTWVPGESKWSPNRLDSMVHGVRRLYRARISTGRVRSPEGDLGPRPGTARPTGPVPAEPAPTGSRRSKVRVPQ